MDDVVDLLQIKIDKAKSELSEDTLNAINSVDWRAVILGMRENRGYTFEQLGDLEIETELVLCGLIPPENYLKELKSRMNISDDQANELVNDMNQQVFSKIKEELIKNTERKKIFAQKEEAQNAPIPPIPAPTPETEAEKKEVTKVLNTAGIEVIPAHSLEWSGASGGEHGGLPVPEKLELEPGPAYPPKIEKKVNEEKPDPVKINSILEQKFSGAVQSQVANTDHSLPNLVPPSPQNVKVPQKPTVDPYREIPE